MGGGWGLGFRVSLKGVSGDLVNRLIIGITWVTIRVVLVINVLTKSP